MKHKNIPHIKPDFCKKIFSLIICLPIYIFANASDTPRSYKVQRAQIDSGIVRLFENAIIPYAHYELNSGGNRLNKKPALIIDDEEVWYTLWRTYNSQTSGSDQIYTVTLSDISTIRGGTFGNPAPAYYTVIDGTYVFIRSDLKGLRLKKKVPARTFTLTEIDFPFVYDPERLLIYKVDGIYKFYITPYHLQDDRRLHRRGSSDNDIYDDTVALETYRIKSLYADIMTESRYNDIALFIDWADDGCFRITMRAWAWTDRATLSNYVCLLKEEEPVKGKPDVNIWFISKEIADMIAEPVNACTEIAVARSIPSFVPYVDLPYRDYKPDVNIDPPNLESTIIH